MNDCPDQEHLAWVFQVPPEISKEHNEIFNYRARLLILALLQVSGSILSLAEKWPDSFEPEA
jgi:hypothetical protein